MVEYVVIYTKKRYPDDEYKFNVLAESAKEAEEIFDLYVERRPHLQWEFWKVITYQKPFFTTKENVIEMNKMHDY